MDAKARKFREPVVHFWAKVTVRAPVVQNCARPEKRLRGRVVHYWATFAGLATVGLPRAMRALVVQDWALAAPGVWRRWL